MIDLWLVGEGATNCRSLNSEVSLFVAEIRIAKLTTTANIGMIGLGVMGQNLTLNIERNGYSVAVWEREPAVLDSFVRASSGKTDRGRTVSGRVCQIDRVAAQNNTSG